MNNELNRLLMILDLLSDEFERFEFESETLGVYNGLDTCVVVFSGDEELCNKVAGYAKKIKKKKKVIH